ncbi:DUF1553 domain-containing protein [Planctomycetes bacterium Poly30]
MSFPLVAALILLPSPVSSTASERPDFATEVRPILARRCFACHGNDEETREAGLRLDSFAAATRDRDGFPAVLPGRPDDSEMIARIIDEFDPMPPESTGESLDAGEIDVLRRWIEGGAEYAPHWAFVAPERPETPGPEGVHPIDAFVAEQHATRGLDWSPQADDYTLFRRLSLDLTGLPPEPEAARAFAESRDPGKYDAAVEALLDSPAYAERWAAVWLDLARYADSSGHGSDPLREIWRYRDWVIDAFDRNMPFDEFTEKQLAGDLLPDADVESRLATAFHRNTMTNTEGGTDNEEFRVLAVKDRVNTTMSVWMGLTAGCAECHSHKYDPISHVEYYQLFDLFNQTEDADRDDDRPRLATPTPEQKVRYDAARKDLDEAEARLRGSLPNEGTPARLARERQLLERVARQRWTPVMPDDVPGGLEGARLYADGTVLNADTAARARQRVTWLSSEAAPLRALRLDAVSDPSLPRGGPGLAPENGNFVLTDLALRATRIDVAPVEAASVRIELPGESRILSIAEVELLGPEGAPMAGALVNARQSTTGYGGEAGRAVDGRTEGSYELGSVTHTAESANPWWEAELAAPLLVSGVRVWPRTDGTLESRLHGFRVVLLDGGGAEVWRSALAPAPAGDGLVPDADPFQDVGPVVGQPLLLRALGATHEQKGFDAARAVDGIVGSEDGWAIGGGQGAGQAAVFALPALEPGYYRWDVTLAQEFGGHLLGKWRLSTSAEVNEPLLLSSAAESALRKVAEDRDAAESKAALEAILAHDADYLALVAQRDEARARLEAIRVPTTPVMVELPAERRRTTHVLTRGNFLQPEDEVRAAVPAVFPPLPDGVEPDRLALAKWLMSDVNPLTSRVTVNRVWARLFGRGLVPSEGDFGSQAELPSHPKLLDWLAVEFRTSGWDHKALLRTLVHTRTYRQSSDVRGTDVDKDPEGVWLSRYPRQRLEAEMVRDSVLAASGLLSHKRFGPSVFPPQPEGLWQAAFNGQRSWMESEGEDRYRRGLYVFLRRTVPYPMLATFDAPSRESCTVQRIPTNTPLQAFVTLNDPVFVEASQALARRSLEATGSGGDDASVKPSDVIERMLWFCLSRPPAADQVAILEALHADALLAFEVDPDAAMDFGHASVGETLSPPERAAWTLVASAALNLDRALTKE